MPGTHYDNDHSFIDELSFDYKQSAYLILRDYSLEYMMIDYRNGVSKCFNNIAVPLEREVKKTISACIIAKITSFEKTLYINRKQYQFLVQLLIKHINAFTREEMDKSEILGYLKVDRKKTYLWLLALENEFEKKGIHYDDA